MIDYVKILDRMPKEYGLLITDTDFGVIEAKGRASLLLEEGKLMGHIESVMKRALEKGSVKIDTETAHVTMKAYAVSEGEKEYYVMWIHDERKSYEAERKLRYCLEILDNINEGVIVTDKSGRILIYNRKLGEFEDLNKDEVVGRRLMDVYEWSMESSEHYQVLKTGRPIKEGHYRNLTKLGKCNQLIASTYPITADGSDEPEAVYSISRNVTTIKEIYNRTMEIQKKNNGSFNKNNGTRFVLEDLICKSPKMKKLLEDVKTTAHTNSPALVYGETGTGKEMIIQGMHNAGPRSEQPFVALNCAALPETLLESLLFGTKKGAFTGAEDTKGFFEHAGKGTLYLDEINSMPLNLQAKLLRAVQEKRFRRVGDDRERFIECRIVSSVNMEPMRCVENGNLRQDLYYRLSVITLEIPPLRNRREDIEELTMYFLHKYSAIYGRSDVTIDEDLREALIKYDWPGNVRELEHLIESAISLMNDNESISLYSVPQYLRKKLYTNSYMPPDAEELTLNEIINSVEKKAVMDALEKHDMNISRAAGSIGISRQNMQYRIEKLGLKGAVKSKGDQK